MDERVMYTCYAQVHGWFPPHDRDVIGDGDGKRLIIPHAMTEGGLLAVFRPSTTGTSAA